jgi:hypothetical protein
MTEEPKVFGEQLPFTLIHGDDLNEVVRFLSERGIAFTRVPSGPSLYKLQFLGVSGETVRLLMRELVGAGRSVKKTSISSQMS